MTSVSSSGWIDGSSSHENGVDTWPPARGRTDHAPNTVLCGAFWLKSMNTREPRSSFHHCRGDELRTAPFELAAHGDRSGANVVRRPARFESHVDVQAAVARRLRERLRVRPRRAAPSTRPRLRAPARTRHRVTDRGRCATRRRARGRRRGTARRGSRCSRGSPPTTRARGRGRRARRWSCRWGCSRPWSAAIRGAPSGTRFWNHDLPVAPSGNRCNRSGRPRMAAMSGSATDR